MRLNRLLNRHYRQALLQDPDQTQAQYPQTDTSDLADLPALWCFDRIL